MKLKYLFQLSSLSRFQSTLIFAEHDGSNLSPTTLNSVTAAKQMGGDITAIVAGPKCADVAKQVTTTTFVCLSKSDCHFPGLCSSVCAL